MLVPFGAIPEHLLKPLHVDTALQYNLKKLKIPNLKDPSNCQSTLLLAPFQHQLEFISDSPEYSFDERVFKPFGKGLKETGSENNSVWDPFESSCGGGITFSNMVAIKIPFHSDYHESKMNCSVSYSTAKNKRLVLRFKSMNLPGYPDCWNNKLDLYDGRLRQQDKMTGSGLCGSFIEQTFTTTSNTVYVQLQSKMWTPERSFVLIISDEGHDQCPEDDVFTCDNGWCIGEEVRCDGWRNCADGTDETVGCGFNDFLAPWFIAVISIGGLLVFGLFLAGVTMTVRKLSGCGYTRV